MICQNCGETNASGDIFCQSCGAVLASEEAQKIVIVCPACRTNNTMADKYCLKCGTSLAKIRQQKIAEKPQVSKPAPEPFSFPEPVPVFATAAAQTGDVSSADADFDLNLLTSYASPRHGNICTYCDTRNEENAVYCSKCGKRVYTPTEKAPADTGVKKQKPKAASKKKPSVRMVVNMLLSCPGKIKAALTGKNKKQLLQRAGIGAAAVLVLVLLIALIAGLSSDDSLLYDTTDFETHYAAGTGKLSVYADGKTVSDIDAAGAPTAAFYDLRATCGVFTLLLQEQDVAKNAVYSYSQKKVTRILDTANTVINLSADGTGLLYIDANAALCLFDMEAGTSAVIAENGKYVAGSASAFAISSDGDYVLYCYKTEAGTNAVSVYGDGVSKDICQSGVPIAISEGGNRIYYLTVLNNTYDFYCTTFRKPDTKSKKMATGIYAYSIRFNTDLSEVLFTLIEGDTYYSKNGKQAESVATTSMFPLLCNYVNSVNCSGIATIYGIDSFFGGFWVGENGLYVVRKDTEPHFLGNTPPKADLSADGSLLAFTDEDGTLYVVPIDAYAKEHEAVAENVTATAVTDDGKNVYYLDASNRLFCVSTAAQNGAIAENVEGIKCTRSGIYYKNFTETESYSLYYCSNGKTGKEVSGDVQAFRISDGCAYYTSGDGQHIYYSKNGNKRFKQLF